MKPQSRRERLSSRPIRQRNGKRGRRAIVRLRHALARKKFIRWGFQTNNLPATATWLRPAHHSYEWHVWHRLGCP